ncbi:MAG: nucleoside kinase [Lachnospiraceae bacterium]|nr:nucleoside kinase [Lachnospiraceae bacterium]
MGAVNVTVYGETIQVEEGTALLELAKRYQEKEAHDIVMAYMDTKLCELMKPIVSDCQIRFLTTADEIGFQSYKRSATLLMLKAIDDVMNHSEDFQVRVMYSLGNGYYCEIEGLEDGISTDLLYSFKRRMKELIWADIPIRKESINTDLAMKRFKEQGMYDKVRLFQYRRVSSCNVYSIDGYEDYHYGYMVPSTGYIKCFDLIIYSAGFVLQLPAMDNPEELTPFEPKKKLFRVLKESDDWGKMLQVDTVGALNDVIADGGFGDLMLVQEALQEKKIAEIAERIERELKQFILIAGPSSSGKTTFSHRLSIQLRAHGLTPHAIAMDDYFVDREMTPKNMDGSYNFECLEAIDLDQFNNDMKCLLEGKTVEIPRFNFHTGKREYKGDYLTLGAGDVLVIEGIHALNPKSSELLPEDSKFKIYISALTSLNIDLHNRISTTDGRLIRRLVRDARTRGNSARDTISMWASVRRGEEKNIFPFQEEADVMFNSALLFELSVIKQYAEPLLFSIPHEAPEYQEAKRLLKFLDYFMGVSGEDVPKNSILREFIGGSCFHV